MSHVITFGAPLVGGAKYTALASTYRARGVDLDETERELARRALLAEHIAVTSIFSKLDGVVSWPACIDRINPQAENIEVVATHLGLGFHHEVWRIVADRLARPHPSRTRRRRPPMHDDHVLVEARIRRELMERVMPAMYWATIPFTVSAWDVPGEPVAHDEAVAATYRPFAVGQRWSRPWGTTWFRFDADVPPGWVGPQLEAVIDLGFHPDSAGFQAEGLVWEDGVPLQGVHPRRTGVPLPEAKPGPLSR